MVSKGWNVIPEEQQFSQQCSAGLNEWSVQQCILSLVASVLGIIT